MTTNQITKALKAAGIEVTPEIEINRDEVTVCVGYTEENGFGTCNQKKTAALKNKIIKALGWNGGFTTGYGAWILTPKSSFNALVFANID